MTSKQMVLPLVAGVGIGAVTGYALASVSGVASRPRISASAYSVPAGGAYTLYFIDFPASTQLVSARNSSIPGGDLVNVGTTDATGKLTVNTNAASTPGNYYLVAWDAPTGKYCAVVTITVT